MRTVITKLGTPALLIIAAAVSSAFLLQERPRPDPCAAVLVADIEYDTLDRDHRLAWLSTITRENFEQRKQKAGGSLKWGSLDLGGDYESFNANRSRLFQQEGYSESEDLATSRLRSIVPPEARQKWLECRQTVAQTSYGLHVWVARENETGADIVVRWRPTGGETGRIRSQQLIGGTVSNAGAGRLFPAGQRFQADGTATALIERNEGAEIRGAITINNQSRSFYVPAVVRANYQVNASIVAKGFRRTPVSQPIDYRYRVGQCTNDPNSRRVERFCLPQGQRAVSVGNLSTAPLPNGNHAPNSCFVARSVTFAPDTSAANCASVHVVVKSCQALKFRSARLPDPQTLAACERARGSGTPISFTLSGTNDEPLQLPVHRESGAWTGGSRSFAYPRANIPEGSVNLEYDFFVSVTDLTSSTSVQLDRTHPIGGGFEVIASEGGARITLVRDFSRPVSDFNLPSLR